MILAGPKLRVGLVTNHLALSSKFFLSWFTEVQNL